MHTCTNYLEKSLALHIRFFSHDKLVINSKNLTLGFQWFLSDFQCPFIKAKNVEKHSFHPIKYRNSSWYKDERKVSKKSQRLFSTSTVCFFSFLFIFFCTMGSYCETESDIWAFRYLGLSFQNFRWSWFTAELKYNGFAYLLFPTGGLAYGIPRNTSTYLCCWASRPTRAPKPWILPYFVWTTRLFT